MSTIYKIHPAVGVARIGTSSEFCIAPETPGGLPTNPITGQPVTSFRDANGNLLRQAARFRVFAYDSTNPSDPGTEVKAGANGVASIEWTAYLVPYMRCFLARILQFQLHRSLCNTAGYQGPLNRCSIYGNKAAGAKLAKMLEMGLANLGRTRSRQRPGNDRWTRARSSITSSRSSTGWRRRIAAASVDGSSLRAIIAFMGVALWLASGLIARSRR